MASASVFENKNLVEDVKRILTPTVKKAFSDSELYIPPSNIVLGRKGNLITMSNPDIYLNDKENDGVSLDTAMPTPTTVSLSRSELDQGNVFVRRLLDCFKCAMWKAERSAWMWVCGMIDTISSIFFTFVPGILVIFGVEIKNPQNAFPEDPYNLLCVSYAIQFLIGIMMICQYFKGEDKHLPIIMAAFISGTGIMGGCSIYFVFSVINKHDSDFGGFGIAQLIFAYVTFFRCALICVLFGCQKWRCEYSEEIPDANWHQRNGIELNDPNNIQRE